MSQDFIWQVATWGGIYLLFSPPVAMPYYSRMLFYPDCRINQWYQIGQVAGVPRKEVFIETGDGKKIHGFLFANPDAKKIILLSHGNAGNISYRLELAKLILNAGASVFLYDYRGYGMSEGSPSMKGICEDGLSAYDFLGQTYTPEQIVLMGESLGSAVACYIASKRKSAGLILQSPFASLAKIAREKMPWLCLYPQSIIPEPRLDNLAIVKNISVPLLVVHGAQDTLIPVAHAELIYKQARDPKHITIFAEANHNDVYQVDQARYMQVLKDFVQTL